MPMVFANIATLKDILTWAKAEAADAAKQCPAAYNDYKSAIDLAQLYIPQWAGTSMEYGYVAAVKAQIEKARQTWYAVGCKKPDGTTPADSGYTPGGTDWTRGEPEAVKAGLPSGSWLWLALGVGAVLLLTGKKGKGASRRPTKRSKRR